VDGWRQLLRGDPLPWLLGEESPEVRHLALRVLLDLPADDPRVSSARDAAMVADPIRAILAAQEPEGFWVKPGPGYSPKYRGTVWQVIFLSYLGADGTHPQIRAACEYVLDHTRAASGGFGCSGSKSGGVPPPSRVLHCLNGNLVRALAVLGYADDPRLLGAAEWQARAVTGEEMGGGFYALVPGPGFACGANEGLPCAWGAIRALSGLAAVPPERRSPLIARAIEQGLAFLLSRDPAEADYPMGWGNTVPNRSWFKLGFPCGYVADVLANLEVLCDLGEAGDPRLAPAVRWLLGKQDASGRWKNEYAYNGKTWVNFELQGQAGKWVTLRACRVLKAVAGFNEA
jgi:hypothetical protein